MDNPSKLFRLSLLSPGDYTGRILYYDIRGNLLDGGVYQDGEQIGSIRPPNGDDALTRGDVSTGGYYERFIVEWVGMSRGLFDDNLLDEVIVIGQRPYTPCFYTGGGGGIAGGGGGTTNPPNNNTTKSTNLPKTKPKVPVDDCNDNISGHKNGTSSMYSNLLGMQSNSEYGLPSYQDYINMIKANPAFEYGLAMNYYDEAGYVASGQIATGTENRVSISLSPSSVCDIHNHPNNTPPSPMDVWRSISTGADSNYSNYQGSYIYNANGDCYCIRVTDRSKASQFKAKYSQSDVIDASTNGFKDKSDFDRDYKAAKKKYAKLGTEDAWCHALSYMAEQYGMGIVVLRRDKNTGNFESKHVKKDSSEKYVPARCK